MPGIPIKPAVLNELQRQLNHELGVAHAYTALAVWCVDLNLKGFARFFYKQASEEREHAQKLIDHLLDRNELPELSALPAPKTKFKSIMDVARQAQSMEQANTTGINKCYEVAMKDHDYPAQVLLHWFIAEQKEEEDWCEELVERIEAANCAGGMSDLDRHIERYLMDAAHPEEKES